MSVYNSVAEISCTLVYSECYIVRSWNFFFFMNSREILYRLNSYSLSCLVPASGSLFYLTLSPWAHFGHLTCQHIIFVLLCLVSHTWYVFQIHKRFCYFFFSVCILKPRLDSNSWWSSCLSPLNFRSTSIQHQV